MENLTFKCRKCRQYLYDENSLITATNKNNSDSSEQFRGIAKDERCCNTNPALWYLNQETIPEWIKSAVLQTNYQKGKLNCPKCGGRIGAFNFVSNSDGCSCGRHWIHVTKSRVDLREKSPDTGLVRCLGSRPSRSDPKVRGSRTMNGNLCTRGGYTMDSFSDGDEAEESNVASCDRVAANAHYARSPSDVSCTNGRCRHDPSGGSPPGGASVGYAAYTPFGTDREQAGHSVDLGCSVSDGQQQSFSGSRSNVDCGCDSAPQHNPLPDPSASRHWRSSPTIPILGATQSAENLPSAYNFDDEAPQTFEGSTGDPFAEPEGTLMAGVSDEGDGRELADVDWEQENPTEPASAAADGEEAVLYEDENPYYWLQDGQDEDQGSQTGGRRRRRRETKSLPAECSDDEVQEEYEPSFPDSLTCPICLELLYQPQTCRPCKHVFCSPCLRRLQGSTLSHTKCPLCREIIAKCLTDHALLGRIKTEFLVEYRQRKAVEKKNKGRLPPLPGTGMGALQFLRLQHYDNNNRPVGGASNTLATWGGVCCVVLLMMLGFTIFATTVGFLLWYIMEVALDTIAELALELNDFFNISWQALIILCVEGRIPQQITEFLAGSAGRMMGALVRLVNRTKIFMNEGEVPPEHHHVAYVVSYEMNNGTSQLLTKVAQANIANYIVIGVVFTYVLYRVACYMQRAHH